MDTAGLLALSGFVFAATMSPGPNNIMVMASGATFGFRRSIPHLLGISGGILAIVVFAGLGLAAVFDVFPILETVLIVVSAVYLLWLAWKIATAAPPVTGDTQARPLSLFQAAAFQWVNPKAWVTGLSAIAIFAPSHSLACVVLVGSSFATLGLVSSAIWTWMGTALRRWLIVGHRLRIFNLAMATLLVASLYPLIFNSD
ncbi:LysE family translocator [Roseomonas sp. BN140053]|uniref:LysE family translocator n=1 Tax=Roseomonas sp. BN140053 TaxID=3391898 RepID=UPI0039EBC90C